MVTWGVLYKGEGMNGQWWSMVINARDTESIGISVCLNPKHIAQSIGNFHFS